MVKIRTRLLAGFISILLIFLLLFVIGCSKEKNIDEMTLGEIKEELKDTGEDIKGVAQEIKDKVCPLCDIESCSEKECPESECPECDCNCEIKEGQIELYFEKVKLLKKEDSGKSQKLNFFYQGEEFDNLESASLSFKPRCSGETTPLVIKIGAKTIFDQEAFCQKEHKVNIDIIYLDVGRNTLLFTSESTEEFLLTNINVESEFSDNTNTSDSLFDIEFSTSEGEENSIEDFSDIIIKNFVEYEFNLEAEDADKEIMLSFDANEREGKIIVLVNDDEVFRGEVKKTDNRIPLSSKYLEEGENKIKIIGIVE